MKTTKREIQKIIKEEFERYLEEQGGGNKLYVVCWGDAYEEDDRGYFLTEEEARQAIRSQNWQQYRSVYIKVVPLGKLLDPMDVKLLDTYEER